MADFLSKLQVFNLAALGNLQRALSARSECNFIIARSARNCFSFLPRSYEGGQRFLQCRTRQNTSRPNARKVVDFDLSLSRVNAPKKYDF